MKSGGVIWRLVLLAPLVCVQPAAAQAWITPTGEGTISLVHQFLKSNEHLDQHGHATRALGAETIHSASLDVSYGLRERVAIEGSIVWLATKWTGTPPGHGPVDTGVYHRSFQDARVAVRYQLALRPVAIAPFLSFGSPTHAYEYRGHSAFGRRLRELQAGVGAAREFRTRAGVGYVHASASYTISEKVKGIALDLDHINGDVEVGIPAGSRVSLAGFGSWQVMPDGLDLPLPRDDHELDHLRADHDRFARASYLLTGLRGTVTLNRRLDLFVSGVVTAAGRNLHAVRAVSTGLTWNFGGGFKIAAPSK